MGDRIIVINGERGWLNFGSLLAFIAVALVLAAYALIPVVVTAVLMTLLFWLVLPRLPGMPAIQPMRALLRACWSSSPMSYRRSSCASSSSRWGSGSCCTIPTRSG